MQGKSFFTLLSQATVFTASIENASSESDANRTLLIEYICLAYYSTASSHVLHIVKIGFGGQGILEYISFKIRVLILLKASRNTFFHYESNKSTLE